MRPFLIPAACSPACALDQHVASAGKRNFESTFTSAHVTRNWRYYITRADWNRSQKLTRASVEAERFCVVDGGMQQPPMQATPKCTLPARRGYQIVVAVWEIGDTANSCYVIDLSVH